MKGILLISGGIDSPVAGYVMKAQLDLIPVYFDNSPFSDEPAKQRAILTAEKIGMNKLVVVKNGQNLSKFMDRCDRKFTCIFCKRMMLRIAGELAEKYKAGCVVTGDNLAQVASQTLQNLSTLQEASNIPVVRPLIGMDKNEIIAIAKKISTYETSVQKTICCLAVPKSPATRSTPAKMREEEAKLNIQKLVDESLKSLEEIKL